MPTFDSGVFDAGIFDATYLTPLLKSVIVEPEFKKVYKGSNVPFIIRLQSVTASIGKRYDFNPETTPQVQVYNPDGSIKQAYIDMQSMQTGYFKYEHAVGSTDQSGAYTGVFKCVNGDKVLITPKIELFEVY